MNYRGGMWEGGGWTGWSGVGGKWDNCNSIINKYIKKKKNTKAKKMSNTTPKNLFYTLKYLLLHLVSGTYCRICINPAMPARFSTTKMRRYRKNIICSFLCPLTLHKLKLERNF